MDAKTFSVFKAIADFVVDLDTVFGSENKPIAFYKSLVEKTTIIHEKPVLKHIELFKTFCTENISALTERDSSKLKQATIAYSERVFINVQQVLTGGNKETRDAIWKHLLTINALINPTEDALVLLQSSDKRNSDDLIQDIIDTVTENVDPSSTGDPIAAAMRLVNSGKLASIITNLTEQFTNGTLNPEAMLKKVTQMYSNVTQGDSNAPDISSLLSSIQGMQN